MEVWTLPDGRKERAIVSRMPGKRPRIRSKRISVWVEPEIHDKWSELARREELTLSQWIRRKCARKGEYSDPYKLHAPIRRQTGADVSDSSSDNSSLNPFPANAVPSLRLAENSPCSPPKRQRGRPRKETQTHAAPFAVSENVAAAVERLTHHERTCVCAVCEEWRRRMQ